MTRVLPRGRIPWWTVCGELAELALTEAERAALEPASFVDDRFVRGLDASGFMASLYR